ncbi:FAD-binding oxidoreductase [uncultured Tateyamaria sp.]|nr:FAD-binding oxidoreductase [uncultured Tateyamaria sp.]
MAADYQAIVIGGGIVGCSVLYALAERGWTNTLLLEKNELTSGSTWHAAGNCTHFGHDAEMTRLYVETLKVYERAEKESGQSIGFHKTGSLRLATTKEELAAYKKLEPVYERLGVPYRVVTPEEIPEIHPLMSLDNVLGAAHTPEDGYVDPSGATLAMAACARARGAQIKRHSAVGKIEQLPDARWRVHSGDQSYTAEHIVIATSFWAREMVVQLGLDLPLYPLEHHEIITEDSAEVAQVGFELPTVRDPLIPANIRQERNGILLGIYESQPVAWSTNGIPPDFGQELLVPNLDRLMPHFKKAMTRMPVLAEAGIKVANNGPICYTPDGLPMLGTLPTHDNLWIAAGFSAGIGTGGGSGQYLAAHMVDGQAPYNLPGVDPARFAVSQPRAAIIEKILATYAAGYSVPDAEKV